MHLELRRISQRFLVNMMMLKIIGVLRYFVFQENMPKIATEVASVDAKFAQTVSPLLMVVESSDLA